MAIIDSILDSKKTAFSFEILPPLKGNGIEKVFQSIDPLLEFNPKYINITTHHSEFTKHVRMVILKSIISENVLVLWLSLPLFKINMASLQCLT